MLADRQDFIELFFALDKQQTAAAGAQHMFNTVGGLFRMDHDTDGASALDRKVGIGGLGPGLGNDRRCVLASNLRAEHGAADPPYLLGEMRPGDGLPDTTILPAHDRFAGMRRGLPLDNRGNGYEGGIGGGSHG